MATGRQTDHTDTPPSRPTPGHLTRAHRILIAVVIAGAVLIAAIGFAGSYGAVRDLAQTKGFGGFSSWLPIGIDAGIVVLLALDLLLTWLRIPFPLLRHTAWLLTAATIAFNAAAAWPDPLGVGMHGVIPILFVVAVEAARHAIGRIADITADKHMEGVRISRWLLAFPSTFRLWRRMKLWELRSYEEVIRLEQERLIYRARLRARYGRRWRSKAPVELVLPLKLARFGKAVSQPAPAIGPVVPEAPAQSALELPFDAAAQDALAVAGPGAPALPAAASVTDASAPVDDAPLTAPAPASAPNPHFLHLHSSASAPPASALANATASGCSAPVSPNAHPVHPERSAPKVHPNAPAFDPYPDALAAPASAQGALILDLAKMRPPHPDVVNIGSPKGPQPHPKPPNAPAPVSASDAGLVDRARALAGPVSLRRLQREFSIGQARATRIRDALAASASASDREQDAS